MMERSYKSNMMKCNLFVQVVILNIELLNLLSDVYFCCINLFFTYVIFKLPINYVINYTCWLGIINFEKNMFLLMRFGKNVFLFFNF